MAYQAPLIGITPGTQGKAASAKSSIQLPHANPQIAKDYFAPYVAAAQKAGQTFNPQQPSQPLGVQAKSPTQNVQPKPNVLPPSQVSTSPGSYKGVAITPGTDAQIQAQMKTIDAKQTPPPAPATQQQTGQQQQTQQTQQTQQPQQGLYGQLISQLQKTATGQTQPAPQVAQTAQEIANIQKNIGNLRQQAGLAEGGYTTGGLTLPVSMGRAQQVAQTEAQQEQGLGIQQQAAQGLLQNILSGQQLSQTGLQQAAALAQPQVAAYGQTVFNPVTGQYEVSGTGGVSPTDPLYPALQQYAQMYATGQQAGIPSSITGNPVLNAQVLSMAQQINPNFNVNQAIGQAAAQQSNIQTAGTAGVSAAQQVFNNAYSTYNQLQNATQNIDQFGNLLTQTMQQGGINPTDVKYANQSIQQIRNQLSSSQQAVYDNTLASLRSRVSGLLSAGGSEVPSAITSDAQKILDGSLPLSSLSQVLARIQQEGQVLLQNQAQIVNQNWQKIQQPNTQQNATGNTQQPAGWF